jgi:hypothetical protein
MGINFSAYQWPQHSTVASMVGSLPMGGSVPETPIHAFTRVAEPLIFSDIHHLNPVRTDIDLGGLLAFSINNVVTASEADAIIEATERFGYRDEAPGISTPPGMRMNKSVHWMADDSLTQPLFNRISALLPQHINGVSLYPRLSQRINMYRYDDNDIFNRHTDGDWPGYSLNESRTGMREWRFGVRSALTMILYLNGPEDGVRGGNTRLLDNNGFWNDIVPMKGSALFFRHGFSPASVIHEGSRVHGPVPKYVARINIMYGSD